MTDYIIDAHMHPFWKDDQDICSYDLDVAPEEIGADLARCGISAFAGSVISKKVDSFDEIRRVNNSALKLRDYYGDRYIPGIHIHPHWVKESCEELERLRKAGVKLIGELVPYMMKWTSVSREFDGQAYTAKETLEIFSVARDLGFVVSVHPSVHEDLDKLCEAFPTMPVIVAHPGEYGEYMRNLERIEKYPNAYLDICGTGLFRNRMLWYGVNRVGAERFLFGTDYPICNPAMQIAGVEYDIRSDRDRELIFSGNFKRLLGLK